MLVHNDCVSIICVLPGTRCARCSCRSSWRSGRSTTRTFSARSLASSASPKVCALSLVQLNLLYRAGQWTAFVIELATAIFGGGFWLVRCNFSRAAIAHAVCLSTRACPRKTDASELDPRAAAGSAAVEPDRPHHCERSHCLPPRGHVSERTRGLHPIVRAWSQQRWPGVLEHHDRDGQPEELGARAFVLELNSC